MLQTIVPVNVFMTMLLVTSSTKASSSLESALKVYSVSILLIKPLLLKVHRTFWLILHSLSRSNFAPESAAGAATAAAAAVLAVVCVAPATALHEQSSRSAPAS